MKYITYMATQKPQILLTLDENLLKRVDDYRFKNRIMSRSEAMRRLLDEALSKREKHEKKLKK